MVSSCASHGKKREGKRRGHSLCTFIVVHECSRREENGAAADHVCKEERKPYV